MGGLCQLWGSGTLGWPMEATGDGSTDEEADTGIGRTQGARLSRTRAFSQLRSQAAAGDLWAVERLRWHVRRRLDRGWRRETIAHRLGLATADVAMLGGKDQTPRLVRQKESR
jgi:hypothetical protein